MVLNFIGNFQRGYTNERADEVMLAQEIENLGHTVRRIPRDEWREHVRDGKDYVNVPKDLKADANIICKWNHFYDGSFAEKLREKSGAPVFYFVWDFMDGDTGPDWHQKMIMASDLYLANDVRSYPSAGSGQVPSQKLYYFPMDVSDKQFDRLNHPGLPYLNDPIKKYDVVFFGSYFPKGDRVEWLKEINKTFPIKIFAWNYEDWKKEGFDAESAVYGEDFALKVAESRITLGFNVNDHSWGYWSNRVGKTLTVGGFLLQRYVPGMELFLRDGADYFSSIEEAREKIDYYLKFPQKREEVAQRGYEIGRDRFTSASRVKELMILIDRFKKGAFLR